MLTALIFMYLFIYFSSDVSDESFYTPILPRIIYCMSALIPPGYAVLQILPWIKLCHVCFRIKEFSMKLGTKVKCRGAKESKEEEKALLDHNNISEYNTIV